MRRITGGLLLKAFLAIMLLGCLDAPTTPVSSSASPDLLTGDAGGPGVAGFEALAVGDQVAVHVESDGCFHNFAGDVVLTRTERGLAVRVVRTNTNLAPGWRLAADTALSLPEVRALDRLLAFYRAGPGEGCTTVDRVTFRVLSGDRAGRSESYVDGSCATFERDDVAPIRSLFRAVRE